MAQEPQAPASGDKTLVAFDQPLLFAYGTWNDRVRTARGTLLLRDEAITNRGGGGYNFDTDLTPVADRVVALRLKLGEANRVAELKVILRDADGRQGEWLIPVGDLPHSEWINVVAKDAATLSGPTYFDSKKGAPDLGRLQQFQLSAGWAGPHRLDAAVESVLLLTPDRVATLAEDGLRLALLKRQQELAAVQHTADSPRVVHVGAVAQDLLEVVVQERWIEQQSHEPYVAQPGDEVRESGWRVLGWERGEMKEVAQKRHVYREIDGGVRRIGTLAGGGGDEPPLFLPNERLMGDALNLLLAELPEAYALQSSDDPAYAAEVRPTAVYRKSKPNEKAMPDAGYTVLHRLYLRFPKPLREGCQYRLNLRGVNTREPSMAYVHDTTESRSTAIHTNQAGYRPDDPHKRAFLSLWKGTGGAETYPDVKRFEVLDASGEAVHSGAVVEVLAADGVERMRTTKNHNLTAVYEIDFSPVQTPGEYRVRVPGIGVSYPVRVSDDAWRRAFRASMHGFLTQRSGVELGPPTTKYRRPRCLHPDDGTPIFRSETDETDAYNRDGSWFDALVEGRTDREVPGAWGGYHDAADYDRRGDHLWASHMHLELLDLFPEYFTELRLRLPGDESHDALPDLLNEALWNVECFERMQNESGGVGGGIEASEHPRAGETSWTDSLVWMTWAPDVYNSYSYAATAARTSRVAKPLDAALSDRLADSARRAWEWAEARVSGVTDEKQKRRSRDSRASAAVELLALTGEPRYDEAFAESQNFDEPLFRTQHGAAFAYARLPDGLGSDDLKRRARERVVARADSALRYGDGNAFGLTTVDINMPLIGPVGAFTTPGMGSLALPRAHVLTGDSRYLAGAVRACEFPLGANPENMVMTTGVGYEPVKNPLHFDSRYSGQPAPAGITIYGAYDRDSLPGYTAGQEWGHQYILAGRTTPPSRTWPATESHFDVFLWPMLTEFTVWQNMGPTSYYWGYLAARSTTTN